jgi:integrase
MLKAAGVRHIRYHDARHTCGAEITVIGTSCRCISARRMHANGESVNTIAAALGVSRATAYRVLSVAD